VLLLQAAFPTRGLMSCMKSCLQCSCVGQATHLFYNAQLFFLKVWMLCPHYRWLDINFKFPEDKFEHGSLYSSYNTTQHIFLSVTHHKEVYHSSVSYIHSSIEVYHSSVSCIYTIININDSLKRLLTMMRTVHSRKLKYIQHQGELKQMNRQG